MWRRVRFTLVELMTVVALLMVLAAIAIPNFQEAQMKSRFSEVLPNTNGILDAQIAYQMATDNTSTALIEFNPASYGRQRQPWLANTYFDKIDFEPDGEVYASYFFSIAGATSGTCDTTPSELSGLAVTPGRALYAHATTDLDGNIAPQRMICCETHSVANASQFGRCGTLTAIGQSW